MKPWTAAWIWASAMSSSDVSTQSSVFRAWRAAQTANAPKKRTSDPRATSASELRRTSDELADLLDLERPDDVDEPVHQRPDPREDQQHVLLLDEELAAGPKREDHHQDPGGQAEPPELVDLAGGERLDDPEDADHQEEEAEEIEEPAAAVGQRPHGDLLEAAREEQDPDDHADRCDRGVVELKDHQADDHPGEPEDEPQPPEAREALHGLAGRRIGGRRGCSGFHISLPVPDGLVGSLQRSGSYRGERS